MIQPTYSYWHARRDGLSPEFIDSPQLGFWRRLRGQRYVAIAIWLSGPSGDLMCMEDGAYVDAWSVWSPWIEDISEAQFRQMTDEEGHIFPDELTTAEGWVTRDLRKASIVRP